MSRTPDGINFHLGDLLPAVDLSTVLRKVAAFLQAFSPNASLRRYDDWWEHDGLHFERGDIEFHSLFELLKSPRAIHQCVPRDDHVRVGVAPSSGEWYLRFRLDWDDSGASLEGDFDVTLPAESAKRFRSEILPSLCVRLEEEDAGDYYRRIIRH